jgi:MoaA/NifB/PqqE/SkfB family radical SAM enzyme
VALDSGLKVLSLTGGEPMVSPSFIPFVEKAHSKGVWISLNTNGILIPKHIDFIQKHIQQVMISLDGFPDINDAHRGKGSAAKAIEAIKILQKRKIKHSVVCVVTNDSIHRLAEIVQFSIELKTSISYQLVFDTDLATFTPNAAAIRPVDALRALENLMELKQRYPERVANSLKSLAFIKEQFLHPKKLHCRAGELFMRIEPNGDIRKCGRVEEIIPYSKVIERGLKESFKALKEFDHCTSCTSQIAIKANFRKIY